VREFSAVRPVRGWAGDMAELVRHLYVCEGLSTYQAAGIAGISRHRVTRLLAAAGVAVRPRGAGRPRRGDGEQAALDESMAALYTGPGWTSGQISALTGVADRTVRARLRARGVPMRTRGRVKREDRLGVPAEALLRLYVRAGLSAADTGQILGCSYRIVLRAAHDEGLPVRAGGPGRGQAEIMLIEALYADPAVQHALACHGIDPRPAGGPIWQRFPVPLPVSPQLAEELYAGCGLGVRHIELLTGQPSQTILRILRSQGIARRPAGGRTPFMRRWRAGTQAASRAGGSDA
jgi:transposase